MVLRTQHSRRTSNSCARSKLQPSCRAPLSRRRYGVARQLIEAGARGKTCKSSSQDAGAGTQASQAPDGRKKGSIVLDKYKIILKIGEGANGVTYEAVDVSTGAQVAVKELKLAAVRNWKQFELFEREAATLRALLHPSIPAYLDYGDDGAGGLLLVQELADGPNLAQLLRQGTRLDEDEVERIARSLLAVLQYLSSRRPPVVHRDLKPENVILEQGRAGGRVLLVDFGGVQEAAAAADGADGALGSTIIGTAGYMPPEQFAGAASPASDLYALGGVLLFLLSGRTPGQFKSERLRVSFEREIEVGPRMSALLAALLDPIPEDRPTASQALAILDGTYTPPKQPTATSLAPPRAQEALQRGMYFTDMQPLARPWRSVGTDAPPRGSRVQITTSGDTLIVEIPPDGLSANTATQGVFAVVWNVSVGLWTAGALAGAGPLFALFSVPFWWAGVSLSKAAVAGALLRETLTVSGQQWALTQELARVQGGAARFLGGGTRALDGPTTELQGARVVTTVISNGIPQTALEVAAGAERVQLGEALPIAEQEYVGAAINRHLEAVSGAVTLENDLYPSTAAAIDNYNSISAPGERLGHTGYGRPKWDRWEGDD
eukprot:jgi/Ulvmu1/10879/UM007_0055.1